MVFGDVIRFFKEARIELSKIVWPSWDDFSGSVVVVLFLVCVFALYLFTVDTVLTRLIRPLLGFYGS